MRIPQGLYPNPGLNTHSATSAIYRREVYLQSNAQSQAYKITHTSATWDLHDAAVLPCAKSSAENLDPKTLMQRIIYTTAT